MGIWSMIKSGAQAAGLDDLHRGVGNIVDNMTGDNQARAARDGAAKQAAAGAEANSVLKDYLDQVRKDQQPFYDMGLQNAQALNQEMAAGGFNNPEFQYQDPGEFQFQAFDPSQVTNDPGYQLMQQEGQSATMNTAAARGSLRSGGTLKALARFNQGLASQEIGNAYNRYSNERNTAMGQFNNNRAFNYGRAADAYGRGVDANQNRFNRLSQLAGYGTGAAAANQQAGGQYATGYGNNVMGVANAQAGAGMYAADARAQGTNNLLTLGVKGAAAYGSAGAAPAAGGVK